MPFLEYELHKHLINKMKVGGKYHLILLAHVERGSGILCTAVYHEDLNENFCIVVESRGVDCGVV